jgi:hypothetical protein
MNIAWRGAAWRGTARHVLAVRRHAPQSSSSSTMQRRRRGQTAWPPKCIGDVGTDTHYFLAFTLSKYSITNGSEFVQQIVAFPPLRSRTFQRPCKAIAVHKKDENIHIFPATLRKLIEFQLRLCEIKKKQY